MERIVNIIKSIKHIPGVESPIEKMLYYELTRLGLLVETQVKIGSYRVDLLVERKWVIECDGKEWHKDKTIDEVRDTVIEEQGFRVIRFEGWKIFYHSKKVSELFCQEYFPVKWSTYLLRNKCISEIDCISTCCDSEIYTRNNKIFCLTCKNECEAMYLLAVIPEVGSIYNADS
jgi:very-short-patch-repair endonuclease